LGALDARSGAAEYELSSRARCFWFQKDAVPEDTLHFTGINGRKASRQVVGFKSLSAKKEGISVKRPWHFAFQAKAMVYPFIGYCLKPHVLFTDDGLRFGKVRNGCTKRGEANAACGGTRSGGIIARYDELSLGRKIRRSAFP
jgi:hypothetical protein